MDSISFKERARNAFVQGAIDYKTIFLDYEYLIYSPCFVKQNYYIVSAIFTNYLHLTGVNTFLSTYEFYNKCLSGSLTEADFDFNKPHQSIQSVKGSVRQKIKALALLPTLFRKKLIAEEDFKKNRVSCTLAATDNSITMGFVNNIDSRPSTLLLGNVLNVANSVNVTLILRRPKGSKEFDSVIQGNTPEMLDFVSKIVK